jgi:hypothetical protein
MLIPDWGPTVVVRKPPNMLDTKPMRRARIMPTIKSGTQRALRTVKQIPFLGLRQTDTKESVRVAYGSLPDTYFTLHTHPLLFSG